MKTLCAVFAGLLCLAGCRSQTPPPRAAAPTFPTYSGAAGQLADGDAFLTFLHTHEGQTVSLDVLFPEADFQGSVDASSSTIVVWEDCDDLPEGQKPGPLAGGCTGFQYTVPRPLARESAGWRLRGQFRPNVTGGPLQGLMSVMLTPVEGGAK